MKYLKRFEGIVQSYENLRGLIPNAFSDISDDNIVKISTWNIEGCFFIRIKIKEYDNFIELLKQALDRLNGQYEKIRITARWGNSKESERMSRIEDDVNIEQLNVKMEKTIGSYSGKHVKANLFLRQMDIKVYY